MSQISESIGNLDADLQQLRASILWRALDPAPYTRQLGRVVEQLEAKSDKVSLPKPPLDAEEVWSRWTALDFDLTKMDAREIRTLCVSPKTAMKARLISALSSDPHPLDRWVNFNGFVQAYFGAWRSMENPDAVERLIRGRLFDGEGIGRRTSKIVYAWRQSLFLFSPEAPRRLGELMAKNHKSVKQSCAEACIDSSSPLASAAHEYAAVAGVEALVQQQAWGGQDLFLQELQWLASNLLTPGLSSDAYRDSMSKLVLSQAAEAMPAVQSALVSLIHTDERLGDPRLAYCAPNWRKIPAASERFLAWLARETLQLFFNTLVPRNDGNRRRAEFWLEYAKKQGKIKDFQVAVSGEDRLKVRATSSKSKLRFASITGGKTSAFLMVFEGWNRKEYVIIEFSETGHAAYIYEREIFESSGAKMRSISYDLSEDLRRMSDAQDRILHFVDTREPWEAKARRKLADLGIRP